MTPITQLAAYIKKHPDAVGKVIDFDVSVDKLYHFDFTSTNTELNIEILTDTNLFNNWIQAKLNTHSCRYGIGGYMEHRTIYARSALFDTEDEPRRLHLGIDIWGDADTQVYAPLDGVIHSYQNNDNFGDYGPTIILQHDLGGLTLYSLYGHLSRESLKGLSPGQSVKKDQQIATLGNIDENGHWPPHLHFQLMFDMENNNGDYPGVARYSEKEKYLKNIPDPNLILGFPK